jgi:IclR family acetate operon transcriptional repressor
MPNRDPEALEPRSQNPYQIGALRNGLEVIDRFAERETWSLAELAQALNKSKPTIFRILQTLQEFGYVAKDTATQRYFAGMRFHSLGAAAIRQETLRWQALAPLQDLARDTGETVHVGILYDGETICVQAVDGTRQVRMHAFVGKRTPAHASALGKVLLAQLPGEALDSFLAKRKLPRFTTKTIADAAALRAALRDIRSRGWALDDEEMEPGLRCLGAPIPGPEDACTAAVAISAPRDRMDPTRIAELAPLVASTGQRIGRMLAAAAGRHIA